MALLFLPVRNILIPYEKTQIIFHVLWMNVIYLCKYLLICISQVYSPTSMYYLYRLFGKDSFQLRLPELCTENLFV